MGGLIIVGAAGSGKDTLVGWIRNDFGVTPIGFADPIRVFLRLLLGPGKHRATAQAIGDAIRAADPLAFVRLAQRRAHRSRRFVITDARLPQELAAFGEALRIGIDVPESFRAERLAARDGAAYQPLAHATETQVPALLAQCQVRLVNDGPDLASFRRLYETALYPVLVHYFRAAPAARRGA